MAKAKAKKGSKGQADPQAERIVRLRAHPRARRQIATAKGWGGLAGFGVTLYLGLSAGEPGYTALLHALVAGIGLYVIAWAAAVSVWRHIAVAEVRALKRRIDEQAAHALAEAERQARQQAQADAQAAAAAA